MTTSSMLAGIAALLDAETPGGSPTAKERLQLAVTAAKLLDRLAAVTQRLVGEAEQADAGMIAARMPVKSVLVHELVMSPRAAGALVRQSVALAGRPATLAAAEAGAVNSEQAAVIVRAVDALPESTGEVTAEQVAAGEQTLLACASEFHAGSLKVLGGRLLEVVAPDEADHLEETRLEREWRTAHQDRFLQFRDDGHGATRFSGLLPTTTAALLRAQLDAYMAAARRAEVRAEESLPDSGGRSQAGSGEFRSGHAGIGEDVAGEIGSGSTKSGEPGMTPGQRSSRAQLPQTPAAMGQRRADALVAMAEHCAAERTAPAVGGDRPRVIVLMGYERLLQVAREHAAQLAAQTGHKPASGGADTHSDCDPHGDAATPTPPADRSHLAESNQQDSGITQPDGRHCPPGSLPDPPNSPCHQPAAPHRQPNSANSVGGSVDEIAAQLLSGERVPAGVLRGWLCDAELLPVVLGGESEVLDLGRARRFATPAQRVALTVRDRGCVFPGCDAPAHMCAAHHTTPWEVFGLTDLGNLALLCWHHHALCEPGRPARDQWVIEFNADGIPVAIPPARLDPTRTPRMHQRFLRPIRPG